MTYWIAAVIFLVGTHVAAYGLGLYRGGTTVRLGTASPFFFGGIMTSVFALCLAALKATFFGG